MSQICAAAAAEHVDVWKPLTEFAMESRELCWIAEVEFGHAIEFGMATP